MHLYAVKIAVPLQRMPIKIILDQGRDKGHILRIGMSVAPVVLAK
jgi:multidrug resistance efflux pump